jgi:aspartate aminotransferase
LFDAAYQGFVSGDPNIDALPVRLFVEAGLEMMVACSFAKNFGLYGQVSQLIDSLID